MPRAMQRAKPGLAVRQAAKWGFPGHKAQGVRWWVGADRQKNQWELGALGWHAAPDQKQAIQCSTRSHDQASKLPGWLAGKLAGWLAGKLAGWRARARGRAVARAGWVCLVNASPLIGELASASWPRPDGLLLLARRRCQLVDAGSSVR